MVVGDAGFIAPDQLETVEILAVGDPVVKREPAGSFHPADGAQGRGGLLILIGKSQRIETGSTEIALLPTGLRVDGTALGRDVGRPGIGVPVGEIRPRLVASAAAVGAGAQQREPLAGQALCAAQVPIEIAVAAPGEIAAQETPLAPERTHVHGAGQARVAADSLDQVDAGKQVGIHRQAVALVAGAGIGEIDAVELDHRLVEAAAPDADVRLDAFSAPFADVDGRHHAEQLFRGTGVSFRQVSPADECFLGHQAAHAGTFVGGDDRGPDRIFLRLPLLAGFQVLRKAGQCCHQAARGEKHLFHILSPPPIDDWQNAEPQGPRSGYPGGRNWHRGKWRCRRAA